MLLEEPGFAALRGWLVETGPADREPELSASARVQSWMCLQPREWPKVGSDRFQRLSLTAAAAGWDLPVFATRASRFLQ